MRIGVMVGEGSGASPDVRELVARTRQMETLGIDTAWIANIRLDALTAAAAAGVQTSRIEIGTAVVPIHPRHPHVMAQQAATAQLACSGRLSLGIGLSHKMVTEDILGLSYAKPVPRMREYLDVLLPLLSGKTVQHEGELYTYHGGRLDTDYAPPTQVLIAALGPLMLRLCGERTAGTVAWAAGLRTLEDYLVPTLHRAARAAGRPTPRVVAGFPLVITNDVDTARATASNVFAIYRTVPSYRALLDKEGASGIEDLVIAGDEAAVRAQVQRLAAAGVSDLCVFPFEAEAGSAARTLAFLGSIAGN